MVDCRSIIVFLYTLSVRFMKNILFYCATILIWGSTWIAIKFQLGVVEPMISVGYRFTLAAVILLLWCRFKRLPMRFTPAEHGFIALQGAFLFAINYLLFYLAELYVASGLAAVIFSTMLLMNMVNGTIFLRTPVDLKVVAGGMLGLLGIGLVFRPEITSFTLENHGLRGVLLCLAATFLASLGNILSARNQKKGLPIVQTNAYGMAYGALLMLILAAFAGKNFRLDPSPDYLIALIYLAVFGSIIAFGCYLSLIGTIGADRAAYATLLFPLVALAISTIWENYHWSSSAVCGVILILSGNLMMLQRKKRQLPHAKRNPGGSEPGECAHPITRNNISISHR